MPTSNRATVLYLLEYGATNADALKAVASLMGDRPFRVTGIFVEDEDVMSAATIPGFVEVSVHDQDTATRGHEDMQRALAHQAHAARQLFESAARALHIDYSFRVSRGRIIETLNQLAAQNDMVIIARPLRQGWLRTRSGQHYNALAMRPRSVLFVNEPWDSGSSVVAICDEAPERMGTFLEQAQSIAAAEGVDFVVASTCEISDLIPADMTQMLPSLDEDCLIELCRQYDARLLIMPESRMIDTSTLVGGLLDKLSCSLLVTHRKRETHEP